MNRIIYYLLAALLSCAACQEMEVDYQPQEPVGVKTEKQEVIITAQMEGPSIETRTETRKESNMRFTYWLPGDKVMIYSAGEASEFTSINTEAVQKAQFKWQISVVTGAEGYEKQYVWGIYPSSSAVSYSEPDGNSETALIRAVFPSIQNSKAGSYADDIAMMIGRSESLGIYFRNVYTGLYFTFADSDIISATVRGLDSEILAGTIDVTLVNNEPKATPVPDEASTEVTLIAPDGGAFVPSQEYYILMLPVTFTRGFTVTLRKRNGQEGTFTLRSAGLTLNRSNFRSFATPDSRIGNTTNINNGTSTGWHASTTQGLNEIWYTTTDNQPVEYNTSLSDVNVVDTENCVAPADNDGVGIIRFESALTTVDEDAFYRKSTLATVSLPETVEVIGFRAFSYCSSLYEIRMDHVKAIRNSAFEYCKFTELILPPTLKELSQGAFCDCYDLTRVVLPESLESIGLYEYNSESIGNPFPWCNNIESFEGKYAADGGRCLIAEIDGQEVLLGFASGGLDGESYSFPEGIEDIGCFAASYATLGEVIIPKSVKRIRDYAFGSCGNLQSVIIQSELDEFGGLMFSYCSQLNQVVINSVNIPTVKSFGYGAGGLFMDTSQDLKIYVPIHRIKYYRNGEYWDSYESKYEGFVRFNDEAFNSFMLDPRNGFDLDGNGLISEEEALRITELQYHGGDKSNCLLEGTGVSGWKGYYQPDGSNAPKYYCYGDVSHFGGIQYLTNLERLAIVDCPSLHNLTYLGQIRNLHWLELDNLPVNYLDFLRTMTALTRLDLNLMPNVNSVYLANNDQLVTLIIKNSGLASLNVSGKTALTRIDCQNNKITDLHLSGCSNLKILYCQNNIIEVLDVSENLLLETFKCYPMNDSSGNNVLTTIYISSGQNTNNWTKPASTQYVIK